MSDGLPVEDDNITPLIIHLCTDNRWGMDGGRRMQGHIFIILLSLEKDEKGNINKVSSGRVDISVPREYRLSQNVNMNVGILIYK